MTVKEFTVASAREHKTFHIHGHAHVVLTSNLHNWMNVFIQEVRSQVPGIGVDENQPVFPSLNGTKMQSIWEKAGIDGPIHGTLLRKGAVTAVHRNHEKEASNLADLMAHKEDTALQ
ncbi:unnamed protein product [Pocillopora meandrina]|uniref:Uncharacterized protein n=1 Tax=Pocillopora meandrina TaxID=46732 RepID=A0AAU9VQJ4_9CNID|nr:unnamed protein product [Pocillopora meandrina]